MKILDVVHIEGCNIRITFLKDEKKEIKDVNLESFLKNHANKHVKKMADPKKLSDIDIHLNYLAWKGNVLSLNAETLYNWTAN